MFNHDICQYLFFGESRILVYLFLMLKFFFYLLFDLLLHFFLIVNCSLGFSICVIHGVIGAGGCFCDACWRSLFHPFWGVILKAFSVIQIIFLVCISGHQNWDLWQATIECACMWILTLVLKPPRSNLMNAHFEWFLLLCCHVQVDIGTSLVALLQLIRLPFTVLEMIWLFFILILKFRRRWCRRSWQIKLWVYLCWWKCNLFQTASTRRIVSRVAAAALTTAQAFPRLHYFTWRKRSIC